MEYNVKYKNLFKNKHACKFKTIKEFEVAFELYCKHISQGKSKMSFVPYSYETIESYINDDSFFKNRKQIQKSLQSKLCVAERQAMAFLESIFIQGTSGIETTEIKYNEKTDETTKLIHSPKRFNVIGGIFLLKNKFPNTYKDKQEIEHTGNMIFNFIPIKSKN